MRVSTESGVVIDGGMGVVIFIFGGACVPVVEDEGADLSLQPVVAKRAKAMMQARGRGTSRIFCIVNLK